MQKHTSVALLLLCATIAGNATADTYLTVGGYYSKVDKPVDRSGSGGQIGFGYKLTDQWSLEVGYDQLINQGPQWPNFANINNPDNAGGIVFKSGHKSAGLSLSILGKTASQSPISKPSTGGSARSTINPKLGCFSMATLVAPARLKIPICMNLLLTTSGSGQCGLVVIRVPILRCCMA